MTLFKSAALVSVFAISISMVGCDSSKELPAELQRAIGTVMVEIDFGSEKRMKSIPVVCSPDSTVLMSLERAQNMKMLKFESRGSGETAFVSAIDGVANEGSDGRNWIYRVNEKLGDKSAGIYAVGPGDTISWSFGDKPDELK